MLVSADVSYTPNKPPMGSAFLGLSQSELCVHLEDKHLLFTLRFDRSLRQIPPLRLIL